MRKKGLLAMVGKTNKLKINGKCEGGENKILIPIPAYELCSEIIS